MVGGALKINFWLGAAKSFIYHPINF